MNCRKLLRHLALAAAVFACMAAPARALPVFFAINTAPPPLPVYTQPACPGEGFLWTPGYWAYGTEGYFWVPGTWVRPPRVGYLWTPAYWGYEGDGYNFHPGYWGPHIGFYGGINYGFGYGGYGYEGGYWRGNTFAYNRAVNNINPAFVHNIYERPVPVLNGAYNHVSYNGGNGGVPYRASQQEAFAAQREQHIRPTTEQLQHQNFAAQDRQQFANFNHGRPAIAAAPTPGALRPGGTTQGYAGRPAYGNFSNPAQPYANRGYHSNTGRPGYDYPNQPSQQPNRGYGNPAYNRPGAPSNANPALRGQPANPYGNTNRGGFGSPDQRRGMTQQSSPGQQPRYANPGRGEGQPRFQQQQRQPMMQQRQQMQPQIQRQQPMSRPQFQAPATPGGAHGRH